MAPSCVVLVDDEGVDVRGELRAATEAAARSVVLQDFLRRATESLQALVAGLTTVERRAIGLEHDLVFDNLDDLVDTVDDGASGIRNVLVIVSSLANLIRRYEDQPWTPGTNFYFLGLGLSPLLAAPLAASRNLRTFVRLGIETIAIAFRLCVALRIRSIDIEQGSGSWSCTLFGSSAATWKALESTQSTSSLDALSHHKLYISEQTAEWVTLSGPPSVLSKLPESSPATGTRLPGSHSALRASHLPTIEIAQVVGCAPVLELGIANSVRDASRPAWHEFKTQNAWSLFEEICHSIAHYPVTIHKLPDSVLSSFESLGEGKVRFISIAATERTGLVDRELIPRNFIDDREAHREPKELVEDSALEPGSIAIVGMAGRFPGSDTVEGMWQNLWEGKEMHRQVPADRFGKEVWQEAMGEDMPLPHGCFIDQPGLFDRHLFNISPREALQMDPQQRLLLTVSYEALQRAGYSPDGLPSMQGHRIASFFGQTTDDWREVTAGRGVDLYYVPALLRSFVPGRLHFHYNLSSPLLFAGLKKGGFLSHTGACKTFHADADGYCRGEGVGVVVLKRLADAIRDKDRILTVIKAHARNASAHAVSITHPDAGAQSRLYKQVLQQAGIPPHDISYVEMHGTGTQAGDATEVRALVQAFCDGQKRQDPLVVGAMKANIGHAEAAAGVLSLMKAIMVLRTGEIPPQPGMPWRVNPKLGITGRSDIQIADGRVSLTRSLQNGTPRRAVLNNFDASGGNVCLVLEEYLEGAYPRDLSAKKLRSHHVIAVSAKTAKSLQRNQRQLADHLESFPDLSLGDLSYTTTARSMHEKIRIGYVADTVNGLIARLRADASKQAPGTAMSPSNVAFVCTGTGAQYAGMCSGLFYTSKRLRRCIESMQALMESQGAPRFIDIIADDTIDLTSKSTTEIQLALVALEIALADLWQSWGLNPSCVIGHSVGEYAALCIAGVLSAADALSLVALRGSLMEKHLSAAEWSMLAIAASAPDVEGLLKQTPMTSCTIACVNAPVSTVVSGRAADIKALQSALKAKSVRCTVLKTEHGFHSAQFDSILTELVARSSQIRFKAPQIPVMSTMLATVVDATGTFNAEYMAQQTRRPVRFTDAVKTAVSAGLVNQRTIWLETGPDRVCMSFVKATLNTELIAASVSSKEPNWKTIASSAALMYSNNASLRWSAYHREYLDGLKLLDLPTYGFDEQDYWDGFQFHKTTTASIQPTTTPNLSLSLHRVQAEHVADHKLTISFLSQFNDPALFDAAHGHRIEGAALCSGSIFIEMALTAAGYALSKASETSVTTMEILDLKFEHPVVVPDDVANSNTIVTTSGLDLKERKAVEINFSHHFHSTSEHTASCNVALHYGEQSYQFLDMSAFLLRSRMEAVKQRIAGGKGHRLQKPVLYKIFDACVLYSAPYQAIDELHWDEGLDEAVATISFQRFTGSDKAHHSPFWLDVLLHLPGFMLNANLSTREDSVHICDGVKSLHIADTLSSHKQYQCYTRIQRDGKGSSLSSVYLLDGEVVVATAQGVHFQKLPRPILCRILQQRKAISTSPAQQMPLPATTAKFQKEAPASKRTLDAKVKAAMPALASPVASRPRVVESGMGAQTPFDIFVKVVSSETGATLQDLGPDTEFADIGVDSLLSIAIVDRFRKFTGVELGANFFIEHASISGAREMLLQLSSAHKETAEPSESIQASHPSSSSASVRSMRSNDAFDSETPRRSQTSTPLSEYESDEDRNHDHSISKKVSFSPDPAGYTAKAVLIHGTPSTLTGQSSLFLICDGAGSATAYLQLPRFTAFNLPTYAVESPFVRCPEEYNFSVAETAKMYITAIKGVQPHGPYTIGGWSAGGMHAYEISRQLLSSGDEVRRLVILDMHIPRSIPPGTVLSMDFIEKMGVATGLNRMTRNLTPAAMDRLKLHLLHTIRSLSAYAPPPMSSGRRPGRTMVIWARKGLMEVFGTEELAEAAALGLQPEHEGNVMQDSSISIAAWFFSKRQHFGPNGWDDLVGGPVECRDVDADHFTLVNSPAINEVGKILESFLAQ